MLNWLKRWVAGPTDDVLVLEPRPAVVPPPPVPPADLTVEDIYHVCVTGTGPHGDRLRSDTDEVEALRTLVFARFRANPEELPTFPVLATRIFQLVQRPRDDIDVEKLVHVLSREPAASALMLRVANSSRYGGIHQVTTVRDAVVRLGIREVANLAVAAASKALFEAGQRVRLKHFELFWDQRWRHALTTAFSASWLSMQTRIDEPQRAFLSGLLHDLGKSVALRIMSQLIVDGAWKTPLSPQIIEFVMESSHVDLGSEAAVIWGLPEFVVDVCQEHHGDDSNDLAVLVRLCSDAYDLKYNQLHRLGLVDEVLAAAVRLRLNQRDFSLLISELAAAANTVDQIALVPS